MVCIDAHQPGADGPYDEADREDCGSLQQLGGLVPAREERLRKIESEGRIDVPVEPLDEIAGRTADDVLQPRAPGRGRRLKHRRWPSPSPPATIRRASRGSGRPRSR